MTPKKALCIHSFTTVGRSSTAVIAPALAAKGIQATTFELTMLIEAAVAEFNNAFTKAAADFPAAK